MRRFLLIIDTALGLISFSLFLKIDWMLSLCILIFTLIYLFGIIDSKKNPQRIDAHLMVGGTMFFLVLCFVLLKGQIELSLAQMMVILTGSIGFIQMVVFRRSFK